MARSRLTRALDGRARANARSGLEAAQRRRADMHEAQAAVDDAAVLSSEEPGGRVVPAPPTL